MSLAYSSMLALGTKAPDFKLLNTNTKVAESILDYKQKNGLLVVFICNHCPFVIHIIETLVSKSKSYKEQGIGVVFISSNNIHTHPQDGPDFMAQFAEKHSFTFPYFYDESQACAKAYKAECTPDFMLFDKNLACFYRGRFDESSPGNGKPVTGEDLDKACNDLLQNIKEPKPQHPSMGCNIKWK